MSSGWRETKPDADALRSPSRRSRQECSAEQDRAAGGHARRLISRTSGTRAAVSVHLRIQGRRVYASLRWSEKRTTQWVYIGEVMGTTREECLAAAWAIVGGVGINTFITRKLEEKGRPK